MATTNYSKGHRVTDDEARDIETLLFLDLSSSIAPASGDVSGMPDAEKIVADEAAQAAETHRGWASSLSKEIGTTLTDPGIVARFNGVRRDLEREIRGGLCTVEQAQQYLEHLEITLLLEQDDAASI